VVKAGPSVDHLRTARNACKRVAERNQQIRRLAKLWDRLAKTLEGGHDRSPWLEFHPRGPAACGAMGPVVAMTWRDDVHDGWSESTIVMDATMQIDTAAGEIY
jgi:hypothetical protein